MKETERKGLKHWKLFLCLGIVAVIALVNVLIGVFAGWDKAAIPWNFISDQILGMKWLSALLWMLITAIGGTFDESTHTLVTGQYGFGGWEYTNGADFSGYKYIVIELNKAQSNGASFRLFDENNYWSSPSMTDIGSDMTVKIELAKLVKEKTTTPLVLSHIYKAGFWSFGGGEISIKNIFLSNDGETPVTGINQIEESDKPVNVYNLSGMLIYSKLNKRDALKKLSKGVYIIGGRCVVIQ